VNEAGRFSFSDARRFSIVTLSRVGYGDILPADEGIRLRAAIHGAIAAAVGLCRDHAKPWQRGAGRG